MNQFYKQIYPIFPQSWFYAFWKFSRPHTIMGTSLSVLALYLITISITSAKFSSGQLVQVFGTWIACLCGNVYIVGLNQLEDIEIDKINKPDLPLASGEFSQEQGKLIVGISGILAIALAWLNGPFLLTMVGISLAIGTAYSLPPIRLKQFPFWAAVCIFSVRGTVVNLGLFYHFNWLGRRVGEIPAAIWVLTAFILVFTVAIAIFKDIPDLEGDRLYNITTFTIQLGQQTVFNIALWVLTSCYLGMVVIGILQIAAVNALFLIATHLVSLGLMWWMSRSVDLQDKSAIAQFYQFIWKLFFLEYLTFPLACILR
jgi:homogentisate phytyltransferase/homogentisate geranylgeranyltransferase